MEEAKTQPDGLVVIAFFVEVGFTKQILNIF